MNTFPAGKFLALDTRSRRLLLVERANFPEAAATFRSAKRITWCGTPSGSYLFFRSYPAAFIWLGSAESWAGEDVSTREILSQLTTLAFS